MPVINDAIVVNQAYQSSKSARPQKLSNGWLVSVVSVLISDENYKYNFYKSENNGVTWSFLLSYDDPISSFNKNYFSFGSKGTRLYLIYAHSTSSIKLLTFDATNANSPVATIIDNSNVDVKGANHFIIDGTELHAAWASKNNAYPSSFNIRYAKGTIATDGSVVWGAVEQRTNPNVTTADGQDYSNPTITVNNNGYPVLVFEYGGSKLSYRSIISQVYNGSSWIQKAVYSSNGTYNQSSPSAIFVPQSNNGLANGLMGVAWHGTDSTHTTTNYIRFSKTVDGTGATWSAMQKLVPGTNASLTANKAGKLFITYEDAGVTKRIESTDNGDNWSTAITVGTGTNPSSLFDLTMNMSAPLTIRKGTSSVLFTGSWTVTTNSVPSGDIGSKSNPSNLLSYAITTDGSMSTITEKVNGVTVGTKTATSGQMLNVSLTDAQWDTVEYGKYKELTVDSQTFNNATEWEQGYFNNSTGSDGVPIPSTIFLRKKGNKTPVIGNKEYSFNINSGYKMIVQQLNSSGIIIKIDTYLSGSNRIFMLINTVNINIIVYKNDTSTIVPADIETASVYMGYSYYPPNTLTIEMGTEKWTYTFTKTANENTTESQLAEALKDMNEVFLPGVKEKLAVPIRSKGGTVPANLSFDGLADAIAGIPLGKKWATGGFTGGTGLKTITGLTFKPSIVIAHGGDSNVNKNFSISVEASTIGVKSISAQVDTSTLSNSNPATMNFDGFTIYINMNTISDSRWIAVE